VEIWNVVQGVTATGFIIGSALVAKFGLDKNPIRTMLVMVAVAGVLGVTFMIREWWWLYPVGIRMFLVLMPAVVATEQAAIQRVFPFEMQGWVFGCAMTFEAAAAPIPAFMIAPSVEFWIIPYIVSLAGQATGAGAVHEVVP
jgi:DHA3 family multidrug efflux protein-like MFS transporter